MFIQLFSGPVSDPARIRSALERWVDELGPSAEGWLGSTAGVTDEGLFVATARFESEEAARRNSERPEQGDWWTEAAECFDGKVTFQDSTYVEAQLFGDPDQARFVQVMRGRTTDEKRALELMGENLDEWREHRPDVLAQVVIGHGGGDFTMIGYFSSEDEARANEAKDLPEVLQQHLAELESLVDGEPEYLDLRHPWLAWPD